MAETDFYQYLANSLRTMLTIRAEELIRVTFSKDVYTVSSTELRSQSEIDAIVCSMGEPINQLVIHYLSELKESGLTTPELVKVNGPKIREITAKIEQELEEQLKSRLGHDDD